MKPDPKYFTRSRVKWITDDSPLKIIEKSRQVGVTHATDYRTVGLVSHPNARFDAFISTRDNVQARSSGKRRTATATAPGRWPSASTPHVTAPPPAAGSASQPKVP